MSKIWRVLGVLACAAVAVMAGPGPVAGSTEAADLNCNETEAAYHNSGYVYLYSREDCTDGNGAKDNSGGDSDHGDDEGQIKNWDNNADSIINTTTSHIEFYNYPDYNKNHPEGDRFCLGPGEWINSLQYYGDASGTSDWWRNSISSHRKVSESECTRWFGWGSNRT